MLKLIGALLLAGGAGALGCSAAAQLSRRVAVLRALLGALEGMEREIAFRLTPMPELLERAAAESPPPVCTLFARCRTLLDELGERSMAELAGGPGAGAPGAGRPGAAGPGGAGGGAGPL